jgi:transcriptional regulator with XRE-family HTH domain
MWNDIRMADDAATPDPKALARLIGQRVRRLRGERGWSLSSLAARAGLGKATLSEIEAGRRNPTLETLYAIAAQLQIGLSELLTASAAPSSAAPVVRGSAVEATLVTVYRDPAVTTEIYRLRIRPGRVQVSPGHGPGVLEHLFITAGAARFGPLGHEVEVEAGADSSWESSDPHSYAAIGAQAAEAIMIIRHPTARRSV